MSSSYAMEHDLVISASAGERASFIRRTYAHLAGAILAFLALEFALVTLIPEEIMRSTVMRIFGSGSAWSMLILVGAFIGVSMLAQHWANSNTSRGLQYAGLGLYVLLEAFIFLPMLYMAYFVIGDKSLFPTAAIMTLFVFAGLSTVCFTTGKDFSFLGPIISMISLLVLGLIVCAIIFKMSLGIWFSFGMVALLSGSILYQTSQVMYHYRTDQYVAAALSLFASFATMMWYILSILMRLSSGGRD